MPVRADFLEGEGGPLALVGWRPDDVARPRFGTLHVPAFGDEMNKSRRMVAQQARAFAAMGGASFVLDLRGTGDSGGDFSEATWPGWLSDVSRAWNWLRQHADVDGPMILWGSRLGALLSCDLVASGRADPDILLLWQPVTSGQEFFRQFMRLARADFARSGNVRGVRVPPPSARAPVEVGGYVLHPDLVPAVERVDIGRLRPTERPVIVIESVPPEAARPSPAVAKAMSQWCSASAGLELLTVHGPSFWASVEIQESHTLIAASSDAVGRRCHLPVRIPRLD